MLCRILCRFLAGATSARPSTTNLLLERRRSRRPRSIGSAQGNPRRQRRVVRPGNMR
jgi:hypothetical protein